jgi:hypothetical protein
MQKRLLFLFAMLFLFLSCAKMIFYESNVSKFHDLASNDLTGTFAIIPADEAQKNSLEFTHYKEILARELTQRGLREVSPNQSPDFIVNMTYSIDSGRSKVGSAPIIGQTSGGYTTYSGSAGSTPVSGSSYTPPTFGVVGAAPYSFDVYTRRLEVNIFDGKTFQSGKLNKRYEGKVISEGRSNQLAQIMPYMFQAMFKEFPGKSGEVTKVNISVQEESKGK